MHRRRGRCSTRCLQSARPLRRTHSIGPRPHLTHKSEITASLSGDSDIGDSSDGQSVSKSAAAAAHSKTQARNVCVPGRPSRQCGELRGVPSLWIDSKARAVPYGRYVALRFSDSVTRWRLPRVIQGTAGLCRRSLLKIPWPLIIQTVSQSPCRSRRRPDSHRHRRTGLWRYTRSCWRW